MIVGTKKKVDDWSSEKGTLSRLWATWKELGVFEMED